MTTSNAHKIFLNVVFISHSCIAPLINPPPLLPFELRFIIKIYDSLLEADIIYYIGTSVIAPKLIQPRSVVSKLVSQ